METNSVFVTTNSVFVTTNSVFVTTNSDLDDKNAGAVLTEKLREG